MKRTPKEYAEDWGYDISCLIEVEEDHETARFLIRRALKKYPDHHWLLAQLCLSYHLQGQYARALRYSQQALDLAPRCPLTLWYHAGTLDVLGRQQEAIVTYKKLLRRSVNDTAFGMCGEGVVWSRKLLNDCRYRLGLCYSESGDKRSAKRWIKAHLRHRDAGVRSTYKRKMVEAMLRELDERS